MTEFNWAADVIIDTIADSHCITSRNRGGFVRMFWRWSGEDINTVKCWFRINGQDVREELDTEEFCTWALQETEAKHLACLVAGHELTVPKDYVLAMPHQIRAALTQIAGFKNETDHW